MSGTVVKGGRAFRRGLAVSLFGMLICAALATSVTAFRLTGDESAPSPAAELRMYAVPESPYLTGVTRGTMATAASGSRTISFSNGITIDTRAGQPVLPRELTLDSYGIGRPGYHLVQFQGPIRNEWKSALEATGAEIVAYFPENTYLVRASNQELGRVSALTPVVWTGLYQPAYKLSGRPEMTAGDGAQAFNLLVFNGESLAEVEDAVRAAGGNVIARFDSKAKVLRAEIDHREVAALSRLPGVAWIEPFKPYELLNDQCQWVVQTMTSGLRKVWDNGVTGTGQVINSADTGIHTTHNAFRDDAVPITTWGDYPTHRKVIAYKNPGDSPDVAFGDVGWHGTHTAGTIMGNDAPFAAATQDGMAKDAKNYFIDIGNSSGGLAFGTDLYSFYTFPYVGNGGGAARLSSNSWGAPVEGEYTVDAMLCDSFMWDHPDFLLFFATGNNAVAGSVGSPATAKNVVSVGGTGNGAGATSIYSSTSRGPADDGRRKPTICAPATLTSAVGPGAAGYSSFTGTSMATPAATGAMTLVRQYLTDGRYPTGTPNGPHAFNPSAALLKALAVNSGQGNVGAFTVPDNNIGWGRVKIDEVLYFAGDTRRTTVIDNGDGLLTGEFIEYTFNVTSSTEPLKISLVWTDYASVPGAARNLVNNLNLTATGGATTYIGNVFSGGQSTTGGTADSINVEENVWRTTPATGLWTVRVSAANVPIGPQTYALVVSGALQGNSGIVTLNKSHYTGDDVIGLRVEDLNGGAMVSVAIQSTTESTPETVLLTAGMSPGVYTASVPTSLTGAMNGDGKLSVSHGDVITATYTDSSPAGVSTAGASVVLNAPTITGVSLVERGSTNVTIGWTSSSQASSQIYYGTTPSLGSSGPLDPNLVSTHRYAVENLSPNTSYYYDVESTDHFGNTVRDDNGGNHYRFTTSVRGDVLLVIGDTTFPELDRYRNAFIRSGWNWDEAGNAFAIAPAVGTTTAGLRSYPVIWWQAGWEQYPPFVDAARDSIARYNAGGGRLCVVSHDVAWAFGDPSSGFWSAARSTWLQNELHVIQNSDPTTWSQTGGIAADPISGAYTGGITYSGHRAGAHGDVIDSFAGSGTASYVWRKAAPIPFDDCAVRWTAGAPGGSPDSAVWGGTPSRIVTNTFEWARLNTGNEDDVTRADVLDKTLRWLIGRAHPNVAVTTPNGGENFVGTSVTIAWTESTDGGTGVGSRRIEYSDDAGESWKLISGAAGPSPFMWTISSVPNGNLYRVRVTVVDNGSPAITGQDNSNANFTINRPGGDTRGPRVVAGSAVTSPNPVVAPGNFILSAIIDDSRTGNSNIAGAEWSVGAAPLPPGSGTPMAGLFTSPTVTVRDTVDASTMSAGIVPAWIRGRDAAGVWGGADSITIHVNGGATSVTSLGGEARFALSPSAPNPFNPKTVIRFSLAAAGPASLVVYDVSGRMVRELVSGALAAGAHEVSWNGRDGSGREVASGVYFYRLEAGSRSAEEKMVLMK